MKQNPAILLGNGLYLVSTTLNDLELTATAHKILNPEVKIYGIGQLGVETSYALSASIFNPKKLLKLVDENRALKSIVKECTTTFGEIFNDRDDPVKWKTILKTKFFEVVFSFDTEIMEGDVKETTTVKIVTDDGSVHFEEKYTPFGSVSWQEVLFAILTLYAGVVEKFEEQQPKLG